MLEEAQNDGSLTLVEAFEGIPISLLFFLKCLNATISFTSCSCAEALSRRPNLLISARRFSAELKSKLSFNSVALDSCC